VVIISNPYVKGSDLKTDDHSKLLIYIEISELSGSIRWTAV